jgi:hypothetical protein
MLRTPNESTLSISDFERIDPGNRPLPAPLIGV